MASVGAFLLPSDDGDNDVARSAAENGHEHFGKRSGVRPGAPTSHAQHVVPLVQAIQDGRSGRSRDWVKTKTTAWRVANWGDGD